MTEERINQESEKPEEIIDEITGTLQDIHKDLVEGATQVGQEIERFKEIRPLWKGLGESTITDPDLENVYTSGVTALGSVRNEMTDLRSQVTLIHGQIKSISSSSDSAISFTTSTASFLASPNIPHTPDPVFAVTDRHSQTKSRLTKLDPSLSETYEAIREVLYGTRSDPERGALYLIRQAFDHLFELLAPDDKVRKSPYWREKEGDNPHQVTRKERIEYAAHTHIRSEITAKRLASFASHMVDVYEALNKAHARGTLDAEKSRSALKEMRVIIETWMEAVEI